ncbi:MAG: hypothetical protein ACREFU_13060 [Acetobacteraceae bacterium]
MHLGKKFVLVMAASAAPAIAIPNAQARTTGIPLAGQAVPLPPMTHPPGDIPDTQVFITYHSPLGFSIKTPEGWARRSTAAGVGFRSQYDAMAISVGSAAAPPTAASARDNQAAALMKSPAAVLISKVEAVGTPAGPAVRIVYASNSAPNPVTGKAIRLEDEQYLFWDNGRLATLTLSAPYGADNVDQWRLISRSFRWH